MSRDAFRGIEREYIEAQAIREHAAMERAAAKEQIIDHCAVRDFSEAMQAKMDKSRAKGRSGWHDPYQCTVSSLVKLMREHLDKGDYVDVGNFAMMLWHRTGKTK